MDLASPPAAPVVRESTQDPLLPKPPGQLESKYMTRVAWKNVVADLVGARRDVLSGSVFAHVALALGDEEEEEDEEEEANEELPVLLLLLLEKLLLPFRLLPSASGSTPTSPFESTSRLVRLP